MKKIVLTSALTIMTAFGFSQSERLITLSEIIETLNQNNPAVKVSKQDILISEGEFKQTNAFVLPQLSISHTALTTTNPLMAFGSKLNQEILKPYDFDPTLLNDPSHIEDFATRLEIKQPLINVDGIYQRKAAKAKLHAMELQSQRTLETIELKVTKAYMELQLAYKAITVLEKAKAAALENKRLADNNFRQGYLQNADVLAVEIRVTEIENQLQYAKSNIHNISNFLSVMMNDKTYSILRPIDELKEENIENSLDVLSDSRSDLQSMTKITEVYNQMYKADKAGFLPRLNAFGAYELHDDKLFGGKANGYIVGVQLNWNIFDGSKRFGKIQKSKAEYEKAKLNQEHYQSQSQVELNSVNRLFQDAKNNLKLSGLAVEQSKESLRIRTNRFKEGLEKTSDLLMAETQYAQKQIEYFTTVYQHNYALAYLKYLTQN